MLEFLLGLWHNKIFTTASIAWAVAQTLKVLTSYEAGKGLDWERVFGAGGMPSSHSAFVTALATIVGRVEGWDSAIFGVTLAFALVVMYDAAGVRQAAGRQAQVLNRILRDLYSKKGMREELLKELIGHTPIEVFAGAFIGIIVALLLQGR
ncbi:MAG: divergent PAP2 family protein [Firmicutes bacterium]|nr:divergent PAP2 family protein [Bacillota bacterium]